MDYFTFCDPNIWDHEYWIKFDAYYYFTYQEFSMAPHCHSSFEFMQVISGSAQITVYEENGFEYQSKRLRIKAVLSLMPGETLYLAPGVWHMMEILPDGDCTITNIECSIIEKKDEFFTLSQIFRNHAGMEYIRKANCGYIHTFDASGMMSIFFQNLLTELLSSEKYMDRQIQINVLFIALFQQFLRLVLDQVEESTSNKYINDIVKYVKQKYYEKIKIDEIAAHVNLSRSYMQRLFKEKTGLSIIAYITNLRIDRAKILLKTTDLPVVDIACSVGYNSRQSFAEAFLKINGTGARNFRKKFRKNEVAFGIDQSQGKYTTNQFV